MLPLARVLPWRQISPHHTSLHSGRADAPLPPLRHSLSSALASPAGNSQSFLGTRVFLLPRHFSHSPRGSGRALFGWTCTERKGPAAPTLPTEPRVFARPAASRCVGCQQRRRPGEPVGDVTGGDAAWKGGGGCSPHPAQRPLNNRVVSSGRDYGGLCAAPRL